MYKLIRYVMVLAAFATQAHSSSPLDQAGPEIKKLQAFVASIPTENKPEMKKAVFVQKIKALGPVITKCNNLFFPNRDKNLLSILNKVESTLKQFKVPAENLHELNQCKAYLLNRNDADVLTGMKISDMLGSMLNFFTSLKTQEYAPEFVQFVHCAELFNIEDIDDNDELELLYLPSDFMLMNTMVLIRQYQRLASVGPIKAAAPAVKALMPAVKAPAPIVLKAVPAKAPVPIKLATTAKTPVPATKPAVPAKAPTPVANAAVPAKAPTPAAKAAVPAKAPAPAAKAAVPAKAPAPAAKAAVPAKAPAPAAKAAVPAKAPAPIKLAAIPAVKK